MDKIKRIFKFSNKTGNPFRILATKEIADKYHLKVIRNNQYNEFYILDNKSTIIHVSRLLFDIKSKLNCEAVVFDGKDTNTFSYMLSICEKIIERS